MAQNTLMFSCRYIKIYEGVFLFTIVLYPVLLISLESLVLPKVQRPKNLGNGSYGR